ncbi:WecB/TagA/CpsF family glycosyltransferase [Segetibacter koreensis]|uniref:WecB/TagA/CpsF family glycosyltransferase n=1 Tax=Segetibacter koreensis TaxID=398037 RepID=UPI000365A7C7|nr:WecB/TagA/CpsF family glycosyltransferase [Segetibacter koreensis]
MNFKKQLFTVNYTITDYDEASNLIIEKALSHTSFGVTALAVHGLIESVKSKPFRQLLNKLDMIVPDGQPVRWALNDFHKVKLKDRVAGPILTDHVLAKANEKSLGIYLYGSTSATLEKMIEVIRQKYPRIIISGTHADRFREATAEEDIADIQKINASGADIVLVGRGCPRQEKWVANHLGLINAPMLAIGAAFDFIAGNIVLAPKWIQDSGFEWLYRLVQEPNKLWKRYLTTNTHFIFLFISCKLGIRKINFDNL